MRGPDASEPAHYLGSVTGIRSSIAATCSVAQCPQTAPRPQHVRPTQLRRAHLGCSPSRCRNCATENAGRYAARHNPPVYLPRLASDLRHPRPAARNPDERATGHLAGTAKLPQFTFLVPDLCASSHDCSRPSPTPGCVPGLPTLFKLPRLPIRSHDCHRDLRRGCRRHRWPGLPYQAGRLLPDRHRGRRPQCETRHQGQHRLRSHVAVGKPPRNCSVSVTWGRPARRRG